MDGDNFDVPNPDEMCKICDRLMKRHPKCLYCQQVICYKKEHLNECGKRQCFFCYSSESNKFYQCSYECMTCLRALCPSHKDSHPTDHNIKESKMLADGNPFEWTDDGLFLKCQFITTRKETCKELWEDLQAKSLILVKSALATGKTSLLQLFCTFLNEIIDQNVFVLSRIFMTYPESPTEIHDKILNDVFKADTKFESYASYFDEVLKNPDKTFILLIDDAHKLYKNCKNFMDSLKQLTTQNLRVVCFADWGIDTPGTEISTPITFPCHKDLKFMKLRGSEYLELIANYNKGGFVKISDDLAYHLKHITGQHVGLVKKYLVALNNQFSKRGTAFSNKNIYGFFLSQYCQTTLKRCKGFPTQLDLNATRWQIINIIFLNKKYETDPTSSASDLIYLVKSGLLYTLTGAKFRFSSPLIARLFMDYYIRKPSQVFKKIIHKNLIDFVVTFLPQMTGYYFSLAAKLKERKLCGITRLWQLEVYNAIGTILSGNYGLNFQVPLRENLIDEFDKGSIKKIIKSIMEIELDRQKEENAFLDIYINEDINWGIEMMCEGTNETIVEHINRFMPKGKYTMIAFRNFLLVDFRTSEPEKDYLKHEKYTAVYYKPSFENLTVYHGTMELQLPLPNWQYREYYESIHTEK